MNTYTVRVINYKGYLVAVHHMVKADSAEAARDIASKFHPYASAYRYHVEEQA